MKKQTWMLAVVLAVMCVGVAFAQGSKLELPIGSGTIATIVTLLFTILSALGVTLKKVFDILKALKESSDVVSTVERVLSDRNVTEEEVDEVMQQINEAKGAWKDVKVSRSI